jgi:hypothetical protein
MLCPSYFGVAAPGCHVPCCLGCLENPGHLPLAMLCRVKPSSELTPKCWEEEGWPHGHALAPSVKAPFTAPRQIWNFHKSCWHQMVSEVSELDSQPQQDCVGYGEMGCVAGLSKPERTITATSMVWHSHSQRHKNCDIENSCLIWLSPQQTQTLTSKLTLLRDSF